MREARPLSTPLCCPHCLPKRHLESLEETVGYAYCGSRGRRGGWLLRWASGSSQRRRNLHCPRCSPGGVARGLTVKSTLAGTFTIAVQATDNPREVDPADVILFCVKTYDTEVAAQSIRPLIRPETIIMSLQNGIGNEECIAQAVGHHSGIGAGANTAFLRRSTAPTTLHCSRTSKARPRCRDLPTARRQRRRVRRRGVVRQLGRGLPRRGARGPPLSLAVLRFGQGGCCWWSCSCLPACGSYYVLRGTTCRCSYSLEPSCSPSSL
jgi:hypothetical protein